MLIFIANEILKINRCAREASVHASVDKTKHAALFLAVGDADSAVLQL